MASELVKAVRQLTNLESAWAAIESNGRFSKSDLVRGELERFAEDAPTNLRSLKSRLGRNTFKFQPARGVPIPKVDGRGKPTGKIRPLVIAPVECRIVQRAILNVLSDIPRLEPFIKTPYSFGGMKGARSSGAQSSERADAPSAVPAAISAVLKEIGNGARYFACADIKSFFTRISKDQVTKIVSGIVEDSEFISLFRSAIEVELSNLAQLRERAAEFPIEDLGVAQGNCLSPLLGNLVLANFDGIMNKGDCKCIRYIDDFIILAPTKRAAEARLRNAKEILLDLNMELSPEKSSKGGIAIDEGFDFLGVTICRGAIRPSQKARLKFSESVRTQFVDSIRAMRAIIQGESLDRKYSLASTLKRIDGMVDGWGKHYWFCNDSQVLHNLDEEVSEQIRRYLGEYSRLKTEIPDQHHQRMLGISQLAEIPRNPFLFPKTGKRIQVIKSGRLS